MEVDLKWAYLVKNLHCQHILCRMMIMSSGWRTLLHCCLACVLLAGRLPVSAQRLGSCIRAGNDVDCILQQCSSRITINSSAGMDCKTRVENGSSLNGMVCNRLADAIESIALGHTAPSSNSTSSCIVLDVYPTESGAPHLVPGLPVGDQRSEQRRVISTNLVLRGVGDGASSAGGRGKRQSGGRDPPGSTTTPPPTLSTPPPATGQPPRVNPVCACSLYMHAVQGDMHHLHMSSLHVWE